MNHKRSSLLDLSLSSDTQSINKVKNIKTCLSDHDGVLCNICCMDIEWKPQFFILREYRHVNASNILPLVDSSKPLQSLFGDQDVDVIAEKLNSDLNNISKQLFNKRLI